MINQPSLPDQYPIKKQRADSRRYPKPKTPGKWLGIKYLFKLTESQILTDANPPQTPT